MSLFRNENLGDGTTISGVLVPLYSVVDASQLGSSTTSFTLFIANDNYTVAGIAEVHGTASSSGTLQLEKATGTQAVGAGTNILTGTISLAGAAATSNFGTLVSNPVSLKLAKGNRLNLIFAGTMTSLANCAVIVYLIRSN